MAGLERQFDLAMLDIYKRARAEVNYTPSVFHKMLGESMSQTTRASS